MRKLNLSDYSVLKSNFFSAKNISKNVVEIADGDLKEICEILFAKYEDEWKKYAKEKETKKGVSLWTGFCFVRKKAKEIYEATKKEEKTRLSKEQEKKVAKEGKKAKKEDAKAKAKKQQEKENKK